MWSYSQEAVYNYSWCQSVAQDLVNRYPRATEVAREVLDITFQDLWLALAHRDPLWNACKAWIKVIDDWLEKGWRPAPGYIDGDLIRTLSKMPCGGRLAQHLAQNPLTARQRPSILQEQAVNKGPEKEPEATEPGPHQLLLWPEFGPVEGDHDGVI